MGKGPIFQQRLLDPSDIHIKKVNLNSYVTVSTKRLKVENRSRYKNKGDKTSRRKKNFCDLGVVKELIVWT